MKKYFLFLVLTFGAFYANAQQSCFGWADSCEVMSDSFSCVNQLGCTWMGYYCDGTAKTCDRLSGTNCQFQSGCSEGYIGGVTNTPDVDIQYVAVTGYQTLISDPQSISVWFYPECAVLPSKRVEGGWKGISQDQCRDRGMCYSDFVKDTKWCYVPRGPCSISPENRIEGGWSGITKTQCESRGMCWNDSEKGAKWCFQPLW